MEILKPKACKFNSHSWGFIVSTLSILQRQKKFSLNIFRVKRAGIGCRICILLVSFLTFTSKSVPALRDPPLLLLETWTASGALRPAGIVLASTHQNAAVALRVRWVTSISVAVTHASASNTDIFNTVEVLENKIYKVN